MDNKRDLWTYSETETLIKLLKKKYFKNNGY